jgi:hypothetical protein
LAKTGGEAAYTGSWSEAKPRWSLSLRNALAVRASSRVVNLRFEICNFQFAIRILKTTVHLAYSSY